jgi:class 3 adenylate cyclase/pimeloyl-ACP methyl ester carboxylesterase
MTSEIPQRLAAVLAADIAGYTRLMERDEARVVAAWRRARSNVIDPTVAEYTGRIVKLTGDGFLAEFGTAERAVRAAIAMQAGFAELFDSDPVEQRVSFRMGINVGDIWVDADDIYGTGVNVAARLESLAEPGGISISGAVYDAVKHKIAAMYTDRGLRPVKNVAEPVHVYSIGASAPLSASSTAARVARRRSVVYVASLVLAVAIIGVGVSYWGGIGSARWFRQEALPEIESLLDTGNWEAVYTKVRAAEARVPDAPELAELWPRFSWPMTLSSEPAGATVYRRPYRPTDAPWEVLGETPLESVRIPFGVSVLRLEQEGRVPVLRAVGGGLLFNPELNRLGVRSVDQAFLVGPEVYKLDTPVTLPEGMVRVSGWEQVVEGKHVETADFFIGRNEVTNAEFKKFVDAGGYRDPRLWDPIVVNGQAVEWQQAVQGFTDRTGRPGPSSWEAGDFPRGADNLPVSGVSWYEAAAYARFRGRELPTVHHWRRALATALLPWLLPEGRLNAAGPVEVGTSGALSWVGAMDMLGNVREWTATALGEQRLILGGGWNDDFDHAALWNTAASPLDRSATNGIRLAITADEPSVATELRAPSPAFVAPQMPEPVSDDVYAAYSRIFAYEPTDLRATVDARQYTRNWLRERISFDAAYAGDRMVLYLYLPVNGRPPYQTVFYWPGSAAFLLDSIDEYTQYLDFVVKTGRAVAVPVYKGMFERGNRQPLPDVVSTAVKDLRRSVDYVSTRPDIDRNALAFYGQSLGAIAGVNALAQEPRLSLAIMESGFVAVAIAPEVNVINALPRVKVPTLLMSGEFDGVVPLPNARRFFNLIGAPAGDKKHVVGSGGHFVPREVQIRETLDWLDSHYGPPNNDLSGNLEVGQVEVDDASQDSEPATRRVESEVAAASTGQRS